MASTSSSAEPLGPSSRRTPLVISEIMYHPAERLDRKNLEFVEIYNSQPWFEDLSGCRLAGDAAFEFPPGSILPGNSFLVVATEPDSVKSVYAITNVTGPLGAALPNGSGDVQFLGKSGAVLLRVAYSDSPPWPAAADGAGCSLVLTRPSLGENNPRAWSGSARIGGSPGALEQLQASPFYGLLINELLANPGTNSADFVELMNHGPNELDISGCSLTSDPAKPGYKIGPNTRIGSGRFITFDAGQIGFDLPASGGSLFLFDADHERVVDAVKFGAQEAGLSWGRFPNGAERWCVEAVPTPGGSNTTPFIASIVINEIMYHPISNENDSEYIEIYHRGGPPVDMSGWKLNGGISFTFPRGRILSSGEFLVVAHNSARLLTNYAHLNSRGVVGDYEGKLSNSGERLVLTTSMGAVVDEVEYRAGGNWSEWADGGGSSLELINPANDHMAASNWADSDETAKSGWTSISATATLTNYIGPVPAALGTLTNVQVIALGKSEFLVDDVEVIPAGSTNIVANSTFAGNILQWRGLGTHRRLSLASTGFGDNASLRVKTSDRGDTMANKVVGVLRRPLPVGTKAEIKARVKWERGSREVVLRTIGNTMEAYGKLDIPRNLGTPGLPNSRARTNRLPVISQVEHLPVVPAANQPVTVCAAIHDLMGVAQALLYYRVDGVAVTNSLEMNDRGLDGDLVAGDGIYGAILPPQPAGRLVSFHVVAHNGAEEAVFPKEAPARTCLVRYGESPVNAGFPAYRIWTTKAVLDEWTAREKSSNDPLDVTFVYNDARVVYGAGALYSGSGFNSANLNNPVGNPCDYEIQFPADDLLLGSDGPVLAWPGVTGYPDNTAQNEQAAFWMAGQIGLPFNYRRNVRVFVNGVQRNAIMEDAQRPNRDMVEQWFPEDAAGDLYKMQLYYEVNGADAATIMSLSSLSDFKIPDEPQRRARYRWLWGKRSAENGMNDFQSLDELIQAFNITDNQSYTTSVESLVDVAQWMKTMAVERFAGNWDSFGYANEQNMYFYRPEHGPWKLMMWDIDIAFANVIAEPANTDLFTHINRFFNFTADPTTQRFFKHPPFRREYLRALQEIANGPALKLNALVDAKYAAFGSTGVAVASPALLKTYAANRRTLVLNTLARHDLPFAVTSPAQKRTTSEAPEITVMGNAPLAMQSLRVNGSVRTVTWLTVTNWSLQLPLAKPTNTFEFAALDGIGTPLPGATDTLTVDFSGNRLEISDISIAGPTVRISWNALPGRTYFLQTSPNLRQGTWVDLPGSITSTNPVASLAVPIQSGGFRFYRIRNAP